MAALFLGGCFDSDHFNESEIVGRYKLNTAPDFDVIELKSNLTYIHYLSDKDGKMEMLTGKWKLDKDELGQHVVLSHFQLKGESFIHPGERTDVAGYFVLRPTRFFGFIRLMVDEDLSIYYNK